MNQEIKLPENFDGLFRFTNFTNEDFVTKWGGIEYTYPANKTTPMIISGESPENVQEIRKKFAHRLAEQEFFKSDRFLGLKNLTKTNGVPPAVDLEREPIYIEYVKKCLEPLEAGRATMEKVAPITPQVSEYTKIIDPKESLKKESIDMSPTLDALQ